MGHKAGIGAIFGIVTEEGVVKPDSPVVLLDRENKKIVRRQNTDANGGFTFNGLNEQEATYMVFATDEDGEEPKNALIQDRILPVPAYSGATFWGNWQHLTRRDEASFCWVGGYGVEDGRVMPYFQRASSNRSDHLFGARRFGSGEITINELESLVGAPHIPILDIHASALWMSLPTMRRDSIPTPTAVDAPREHTMEYTIDLSVATTLTLGWYHGWFGHGTYFNQWWSHTANGLNLMASPSQLRWEPSTRTLSVWYRHGTGQDLNGTTWANGPNTGTAVIRSHVFAEGEVPTGLSHIAYTLIPGVSLKLFVNGIPVQSWDLAGESTHLVSMSHASASYARGAFIIAGGTSSATTTTSVTMGPFAAYLWNALTDAQILEHHNALYATDVLPLVTGYAKEIVIDAPAIYARLDDANEAVTARNYYQAEYLLDASASNATQGESTVLRYQQFEVASITVGQPSPVIGGTSTLFNGGYLRSSGSVDTVIGNQLTIEFFIEPAADAPTVQQHLFRMAQNTVPAVWVYLNPDRTLYLGYRLSNAENEVFSFTHILTAEVFQHCVITLDTDARLATLYINGVAVESFGEAYISGVNFFPNLRGTNTVYSYIAGIAVDTSTFKGKLCEVAFYNKALPASRVLAHYNARLIP